MTARRLIAALLVLAGSAQAARSAEIWEGFEGGDLIFQETTGPEADALGRATGSRFTHVGIVRGTGGGPHVVQAAPHGVEEIPVDDFVARGVGGRYAVYRYEGLEEGDWYHPAVLGAYEYLAYPFDPFHRLDPSALYGAELVYLGFKAAGVELGGLRRIGDLDFDTPEGRALLLSNWSEHPDCKARRLDRDACWSLIRDQRIVTPAGLAEDPRLELVYSNFGSDAPGRERLD
jgi:hypothetical protein